MCFFSLLDFFIFPLWVYGCKSETLSMKEKRIFFKNYYYLAILPYLVSFWIFECIHMQFYCKPWCTENKLKGSVSQGALKSKEFASHMNFLIHANLSTSPKWNLSWLTAIKKQRRLHTHHKCTGAIGLLDFHWALQFCSHTKENSGWRLPNEKNSCCLWFVCLEDGDQVCDHSQSVVVLKDLCASRWQ